MRQRGFAILLLSLGLVALAATASIAKSWEQAIADVDAMSDRFWEISREKGFTEFLGTAFNEVDVEMHLCANLLLKRSPAL